VASSQGSSAGLTTTVTLYVFVDDALAAGGEIQFCTGGGRIGTMSRMVGVDAVEFGATQGGAARLYTGCLNLPARGVGRSDPHPSTSLQFSWGLRLTI
jgi:hypothetical protein